MTTILTSSVRNTVTAISPSGKRATTTFGCTPCLAHHKQVADTLARRIGLDPATLIHGETKQGFAFTPVLSAPHGFTTDRATQILTTSTHDPIRLAAAINNLTKKA